MGYLMDSDHFSGKSWFHLACFTLRPLFRDIKPEEQVYKLEDLEKEDRETVLEHIKNEVERLKSGIKASKKTKPSKAVKKSKEE